MPTDKEHVPPRAVGSPVSPTSTPLRNGSNSASPRSREVTLSPARKYGSNAVAPAHIEDRPITHVVSKENAASATSSALTARATPPVVKKPPAPPSILRDLLLYAALGASLGAAFALAIPPLPPPRAAPPRLLIKAPAAAFGASAPTVTDAAENSRIVLAKDAEIEQLKVDVDRARTDRAADASFKQELKARDDGTRKMLAEVLREKDALAARDTLIAALRVQVAALRSSQVRAVALVVVLPPTRRVLLALLGIGRRARPALAPLVLPGARLPMFAELPPLRFPALSLVPPRPPAPTLGHALKEARLALGVLSGEKVLRWRAMRRAAQD